MSKLMPHYLLLVLAGRTNVLRKGTDAGSGLSLLSVHADRQRRAPAVEGGRQRRRQPLRAGRESPQSSLPGQSSSRPFRTAHTTISCFEATPSFT